MAKGLLCFQDRFLSKWGSDGALPSICFLETNLEGTALSVPKYPAHNARQFMGSDGALPSMRFSKTGGHPRRRCSNF